MLDLPTLLQNQRPLRVMVSHCLLGHRCTYKASDCYHPGIAQLLSLNHRDLLLNSFCPEHAAFSTPREPMNIHQGSGEDVLDGKARVLTHSGLDVTEKMLYGAAQMLMQARQYGAVIAILKERSPSCGVKQIYRGENWPENLLRSCSGVTAALLQRNNIIVISSEDDAQIQQIRQCLQ